MEPVYCESVCLSIKGRTSLQADTEACCLFTELGAAQETVNRSFPGKKARSDPQCSIGGNEPCGRGPDGDHFQPRGPDVEPPTGNMTFYIDITCTLRY